VVSQTAYSEGRSKKLLPFVKILASSASYLQIHHTGPPHKTLVAPVDNPHRLSPGPVHGDSQVHYFTAAMVDAKRTSTSLKPNARGDQELVGKTVLAKSEIASAITGSGKKSLASSDSSMLDGLLEGCYRRSQQPSTDPAHGLTQRRSCYLRSIVCPYELRQATYAIHGSRPTKVRLPSKP